jgi:glycosyltransferase involved in cell wall biosynthesis
LAVEDQRRRRVPIKVTVVVPVYNPGIYIEPCIRSLLGQSMPIAA